MRGPGQLSRGRSRFVVLLSAMRALVCVLMFLVSCSTAGAVAERADPTEPEPPSVYSYETEQVAVELLHQFADRVSAGADRGVLAAEWSVVAPEIRADVRAAPSPLEGCPAEARESVLHALAAGDVLAGVLSARDTAVGRMFGGVSHADEFNAVTEFRAALWEAGELSEGGCEFVGE